MKFAFESQLVVGPLDTFQGVCCCAISPLIAQLSPIADIFVLVFLQSRGSYPSHKHSADLEIITQTDVQLPVISYFK